MEQVKIISVEYGNSVLSESMIFPNGSSEKNLPIVFMIYLLQTESRNILVDVGCETMPGFVMENFIGPIKALEKLGIRPSDITDIIITHAHHDHIECVSSFENAEIYIQKDEYESGKDYFSKAQKSSSEITLFDDEINVTENIKVVKIGGHSVGSSIVEIYGGEKISVIVGDECYSRKNLTDKIPTGTSFSPEKSREFIEKYSDERYETLLCHDL